MIVRKYVFVLIVLVSKLFNYEIGGIIGKKGENIAIVYFDSGKKTDCYIPNIKKLNFVISIWTKLGIGFAGMFHSHLDKSETLSAKDKKYIEKIMVSVADCTDELCFPLVLPRKNKIIVYKAVNTDSEINIIRDDIKIINKRRYKNGEKRK